MNRLHRVRDFNPPSILAMLAWLSFISVFICAGLSEYYSNNDNLGGMYATIALIFVIVTFLLGFLTGRGA